VLREYLQTKKSFSVGKTRQQKNQKGFFSAWKPRRLTRLRQFVDDGDAEKAKGVNI
jgi:hypothetical protein